MIFLSCCWKAILHYCWFGLDGGIFLAIEEGEHIHILIKQFLSALAKKKVGNRERRAANREEKLLDSVQIFKSTDQEGEA